MRVIAKLATAVVLGATFLAAAEAQDVVKLGQIEAQTGANAIYGWMGSQGVPIAVEEINKAGGFKVGDKSYKFELISLDTRGDPKEAGAVLDLDASYVYRLARNFKMTHLIK